MVEIRICGDSASDVLKELHTMAGSNPPKAEVGDTGKLKKSSTTKNTNTNTKLTDEELADLFAYCSQLARLVAPLSAKKYCDFTFDGAVIDTLQGLAMLYSNELRGDNTGEAFKRDGLYGPTLKQMLDDIGRLLDGTANII